MIVQSPAPSPVSTALTTVATNYQHGARVRLKFALQNQTNNYINLTLGAGADGFSVTQGTKVIWSRPLKERTPGMQNVLLPGQVLNLTAVWNGRPNQRGVGRLAPGIYTVNASLSGYSAKGTIRIL
jgi:hypothetical protein